MPENIFPQINESPGDDELRRELIARYKRCIEHLAPWKKEAEEDIEFALGTQWTEEDRKNLGDQKRPCLTFNRIKPLVALISGYQRENSPRIKVSPEGTEDQVFSEVFDKALASINKWGKLSYKLGYLFDDGLYCGKGFLEAIVEYDKDPIHGELKFMMPGPFKIMVDPDCEEYDINEGADFLFKTIKYRKTKLKTMYPNKKGVIEGFKTDSDDWENNATLYEGPSDDYGKDSTTTTPKTPLSTAELGDLEGDVEFTHKEYWRKKMVTKYFVVDRESGLPQRFDTKEEAEANIEEQTERFKEQYKKEQAAMASIDLAQQMPELTDDLLPQIKIIEREVPEMWVAAMVCGWILQDIKSDFEPFYTGFPIFRFIADWAPSAPNEKLKVQGITRALKDPQREKNKAKSQFLHIINTQSNSGWIGDDDALSDEGWKKLEKMGSTPGITVKKKRNRELREILPKAPAMGQLLREREADEEFKQISNVNPDLLGIQEKTASGRAISLRIRQAVMALVRIFTNYRYTKEVIGKFILCMMPELFDAKKLAKVIGPAYMKKAISEIYPQGLNEGHLQAFLQMTTDHKYDVEITEADQTESIRMEIFEDLVDLAKTPQGQFIPIDLFIDYMNIPNADEIKKRIQEERKMVMQAQQQQNKEERQAEIELEVIKQLGKQSKEKPKEQAKKK